MKQLEELQRKVLLIIEKNKELQEKSALLALENNQLKEQVSQLEASLSKENKDFRSLESEKDVLKSSIDDLLSSIGSIEDTQDEAIK